MKKGILLILLFLIMNLLFSQEEKKNWKLINEITVSADFFRIDHLNNLYTVKNNTLSKFSLKNGKYINLTYSNSQLGKIKSIDVSKPFQILVFYYDYQAIQFLDKQLTESSKTIFLDELDILESNLVCSSTDYSFFVFDTVNQLICHFDNNLKLIETSLRLNSMSENAYNPIFMLESNHNLYVNVLEKELLIFDNYLNLDKTVAIALEFDFFVKNKLNYYSSQKIKLFTYDFISFKTKEIDLSWKKNILDAKIEQKKLYIFTPKGISIFVNN